PQMPYEIWHGKPASYKYLRVWDSPAYIKRLVRDKLDSRSSLCRYGFLGLTSQLDNDPRTYGEAMSDIDSDKWLKALIFEMNSMGSNQVWTLVDPPKGVKPVGCKLAYKRKLGAEGEVIAFKMDVKTAFLYSFIEEEIYMHQPKGFTSVGEEQKVCRLQKSIYGLKQASRSWNTRFDEVIRDYDFIKNEFDPCAYKKISGITVAYLVLYVDDISLVGNNVKMLGDIKA
ncbi:UNVERIFIED_CONTAM: hypothetical protein Slati_2713400, partial [Sesamum latifolium]